MINTWILIMVISGSTSGTHPAPGAMQNVEFYNKNSCTSARNTVISEHKRYDRKNHPRQRFLVISCVKK